MPRTPDVPQRILHRASGQDVVFLRDAATGKRRMVYLGRHDSAEARERYRQVLAEHCAGQAPTTATAKAPQPSDAVTVGTLCARFLLWAQDYYRNENGTLSREVTNFVLAVGALDDVLRDVQVDALTCAHFEAARRRLVDSEFGHRHDENGQPIPGTGKRHARGYVNSTMRRAKFVVRWGCEHGLVPGPVWASLTAFRGLRIGRGGARETPPVEAVPRGYVDAVLPHLPPMLRTAVELLWHSGMRAGELCALRTRDIERGADVWLYRPQQHKGTWRGRDRVVPFGPRCQELLRPLLSADPAAHLFRADVVMQQRKATWRQQRTSKVPPSQQKRDAKNAAKLGAYADCLDVATLRRAVHRACDAAGVPRFGIHRLRHACGTRLVVEAGDDAARVQLGHADERMVRRYSKAADDELRRKVAMQHA